jgi:hypothetical protein
VSGRQVSRWAGRGAAQVPGLLDCLAASIFIGNKNVSSR